MGAPGPLSTHIAPFLLYQSDTNPYPSTHANTNTNTMNARTTACILLVAAVAVLPGVVAQDEACTPLSAVVVHVVFAFFLVKLAFLLRGRILVLLVFGNKIIHI